MIIVLILIIIIGLIAYGVMQSNAEKEEKRKYEAGEMTKEEKKRYEEKLAKREEREKAQRIKSVKIIGGGVTSKKKAGSAVARGAVGSALLGPVGLVAGAASAKNKIKDHTTFLIEYEDGHKETETVENNSISFKTYIQYVDMDE